MTSSVVCSACPAAVNPSPGTGSLLPGPGLQNLEIVDFSHDPTKCAPDKAFVWCLQTDYNREKHPYACKWLGAAKCTF